MKKTFLLQLLLLLAFWPIWVWYYHRSIDGVDDPWHAIAALALLYTLKQQKQLCLPTPLLSITLLLLYLGAYFTLPILICAVIAFATLLSLRFRCRDLPLGVFALLAFSLPIASSLDFLLSYPLRVSTAYLALPLLSIAGFDVSISGNTFLWQGKSILIDAPCSGIKMLSCSLVLSSVLALHHKLNRRATASLFCVAFLLSLGANALRASSLFFLESKAILPHLSEGDSSLLHTGTGVVVFLGLAIGLTCLIQHSAATQSSSDLQIWPSTYQAKQLRAPLIAMSMLALMAAIAPLLARHSRGEAHNVSHLPPQLLQLIAEDNFQERRPEISRNSKGSFPGLTREFENATSRLLIRSVSSPTRVLHPSSDCFRGLGYSIKAQKSEKDSNGHLWSCFDADKQISSDPHTLHVCERITDAKNGHWSDVSSWYWSALFSRQSGPWHAITRVDFTKNSPNLPRITSNNSDIGEILTHAEIL